METRKKIALMIEHKLGYTNGWRVDDETYENECLMIADELIKLFALPNVVGRSEQLKAFFEFLEFRDYLNCDPTKVEQIIKDHVESL